MSGLELIREVEAGHVYDVLDVDADPPRYQRITFVRRRDGSGELLPPERRASGLLTQQLLRVAILRTLYLYAEAPCDEDTRIIEHLRAALTLYESRAARRTIEKIAQPEWAAACPRCQHVLCRCAR